MKDLIPKDMFKILACPVCKSSLNYNKDNTKLVCTKCRAVYSIKDGTPILLPPEMQ